MSCTTLLVGKGASFDGSTIMARSEDAIPDGFTPKKFVVVRPGERSGVYRSVLSGVEVPLPEHPLRYTAMPNADPARGLWESCGINEAGICMTATETITVSPRVLAADPFVVPGEGGAPGGIGEEDLLTLVLPYIHSAREGVLRAGELLETYGTCESNGMGFSDSEEIWWLETVGGHNWIAVRIPDDCFAIAPNYLNIDDFDWIDAGGEGKRNLCSANLAVLLRRLRFSVPESGHFNPRALFGTHTDLDRAANTPRAWQAHRFFRPRACERGGEDAALLPWSDGIPWLGKPERKITIEEIHAFMGSHYQRTPYDPYARGAELPGRTVLRPVGLNRNGYLGILQLRPDVPGPLKALEWIAMGSHTFNALLPFYAEIEATPSYLSQTTNRVTTESFYWVNRILAALADKTYARSMPYIESYRQALYADALHMIFEADEAFDPAKEKATAYCERVNEQIASLAKARTEEVLRQVLFEATDSMKNRFTAVDM